MTILEHLSPLASKKKVRQRRFLARAATTVLLVLIAAPAARALPTATSWEYFGLNYSPNIVTSQSIGTLTYTGGPGCGGTCTATTTASGPGGGPAVGVNVNEVTYQGGGGGYVAAEMNYYVSYSGTGPVTITTSDSLNVVGNGMAQAYLIFGPEAPAFGAPVTSLNSLMEGLISSTTLAETDCMAGSTYSSPTACIQGTGLTPAPFGPSTVTMESGVTYGMTIWVDLTPGTENVQQTAWLDPTFSDNGAGGTFTFSDGISNNPSPAPEPGSALLLLSGLGGLLAMARSRQRRAAS